MKSKLISAFLILTGLGLSGPISAAVQPGVILAAALSLEQAVRMVQASAGGRVLGAETRNVQGRTVHVIKVLTPDGKRVRLIQVDAESGQISGGR
jgi:uncharacterized membrane protein YkoI